MKLDTRESICPNFYVSLSLLNSVFFFFFKLKILDIFSIMNWGFGLILFSTISIIEFIIFSCVILISFFFFFFMIKKQITYVFLKAKTQYNYKHYFKLWFYIYLLVWGPIIRGPGRFICRGPKAQAEEGYGLGSAIQVRDGLGTQPRTIQSSACPRSHEKKGQKWYRNNLEKNLKYLCQ